MDNKEVLGCFTVVVATLMTGFFTIVGSLIEAGISSIGIEPQDYPKLSAFFKSAVTIPTWMIISVSLFVLALFVIGGIFHNRSSNRIFGLQQDLTTKDNEMGIALRQLTRKKNDEMKRAVEIVRNEKDDEFRRKIRGVIEDDPELLLQAQRRFKMAKRVVRLLKERGSLSYSKIIELATHAGHFEEEELEEVVDELDYRKILEKKGTSKVAQTLNISQNEWSLVIS